MHFRRGTGPLAAGAAHHIYASYPQLLMLTIAVMTVRSLALATMKDQPIPSLSPR